MSRNKRPCPAGAVHVNGLGIRHRKRPLDARSTISVRIPPPARGLLWCGGGSDALIRLGRCWSGLSTGNPRENRTDLQASEIPSGVVPSWPTTSAKARQGETGGEGKIRSPSSPSCPRLSHDKSWGRVRGPVDQPGSPSDRPPSPDAWKHSGCEQALNNGDNLPSRDARPLLALSGFASNTVHKVILASLTGHCTPPVQPGDARGTWREHRLQFAAALTTLRQYRLCGWPISRGGCSPWTAAARSGPATTSEVCCW